jgi:hypothetical protein
LISPLSFRSPARIESSACASSRSADGQREILPVSALKLQMDQFAVRPRPQQVKPQVIHLGQFNNNLNIVSPSRQTKHTTIDRRACHTGGSGQHTI